ncbi:MAG: alpha/beta hydrolase family protein [Solirubrobacterales bacterium]
MSAQIASLRVRMTLVIAAVAAGILVLGLCAQAPAAKRSDGKKGDEDKVVKGPKGGAFYKKPPKPLPKQHGDLIWARGATGIPKLADARYTKLVLYSSRSPQGKRIAVSGSLSVPKGKAPKRGWPVITFAHGTTGVADVCAPSRDRVGGPLNGGSAYIDPLLNEWLRAGYAVVRTDYPGLGTRGNHPYLIGVSEGRGVLDIVRAARELDDRIGRRFLVAGHSQGGQAALFAAGLAKAWAKGLKLRGTVAFAPASHIVEQVSLLPVLTSPSGLTALAVLIVDGASTQSKAINVRAILSDRVLAFYPFLQRECIGQLGSSSRLGSVPPSEIQRQGSDLSPLLPQLAKMNPLVRTRAPIMIAQGEADMTVFPNFTDQLNGELVGAGNKVTYRKYPGVGHGDIPFASQADALAFLRALLPPPR